MHDIQPSVLIFGGGHISKSLAMVLDLAGFRVTVIDNREAFANKERFPQAAGVHAGNLMTMHCAWMLEQGKAKEARPYSSMAKNHVARLLCQTLDDAIQMHGALGYSDDMPFAQWYRYARSARIADGPDEVHDVVVARDYLRGRLDVLV